MKNPSTILVIDDDPDIRLFCRSVLEPRGHRVIEAETGALGMEAIRAELPDLIVLDVMIEDIDTGFQMAGAIRARGFGMPVVILSSIADATASEMDTSTLPVQGLLNKPIRPSDLVAAVERLLPRSAP
jgi:DNA-binding response OmpR family regulator